MLILKEVLYRDEHYKFLCVSLADLNDVTAVVLDTGTREVFSTKKFEEILGVVKGELSYNNIVLDCYRFFTLPKHFWTFLDIVDSPELVVKAGSLNSILDLKSYINNNQEMKKILQGVLKGHNKFVIVIGSDVKKLDELGLFWECDNTWHDVKPLSGISRVYTRTTQGAMNLFHIYDKIFNLGIEIPRNCELYFLGRDCTSDVYKLSTSNELYGFFAKIKILRG